MSVTVQKLLNEKYRQVFEDKVIYVLNVEKKIKLLSVEEFNKLNKESKCVYTFRCFISNDEVSLNSICFFNFTPFQESSNRVYFILFNDFIYQVTLNKSENQYTTEDLAILIKEKIYKDNKRFEQIKKQVELYEKLESSTEPERREPIPEDVRFEVWRRDGGKCVICGSQKNLEFDHIIPFSKGGSSTARNIQLLCQDCNRHKSDTI